MKTGAVVLRKKLVGMVALALMECTATVFAQQAPPSLLNVVSRRTHGTAGTFDLQVNTAIPGAIYDPLHAGLSVEPRVNPPSGKLLVFTFSTSVTSLGSVSVSGVPGSTLATGTATATFSGNTVFVTLTGVANGKRVAVSLNNVNGTHANYTAALGYLVGDVTLDGQVTGFDSAYAGASSPAATTANNFQVDVDANGVITGADKALVSSPSPSALESASNLDLLALWEARNKTLTDTFYTTNFLDRDNAVAVYGADLHGVAAWIPCALDDAEGPIKVPATSTTKAIREIPTIYKSPNAGPNSENTHGYAQQWGQQFMKPPYLSCLQPGGSDPNSPSTPLYRMFKSTPQTDHLYVTSDGINDVDANGLESSGYTFERVEGYVFKTQVANSVPLYRLSRAYVTPAGDVEHRYTISDSAKQSLLNAGWADEGITGYVFATYINSTVKATGYTGTFNGVAVAANGPAVVIPIQNVKPPPAPANTTVGGFQPSPTVTANSVTFQPTFQYGVYGSNTTVRPPGTVRQYISFDYYSGDLGQNHIPIYLHYASGASPVQLSVFSAYDGIAVILEGSGQIGIELGQPGWPLQVNPEHDSNLVSPLETYKTYRIEYSLDDNATVTLTVYDYAAAQYKSFVAGGTTFSKSYNTTDNKYYKCPFFSTPAYGALLEDQSYCANSFSGDKFPVNNTGYMIYPYFSYGPTSDNSEKITNLQTGWQ